MKLIPFFDIYQLKNEKLLIYIKCKFIVEKLLSIDEKNRWYNKDLNHSYNDLMLDLITISTNLNVNVKPSVQLRYLSENDKNKVLSNKLSIKIKDELNTFISNYKKNNDLNIDFINGLFDSDGWISLRLSLHRLKNTIFMGFDYGIVSDMSNIELLYSIKKYFNNVGRSPIGGISLIEYH